MKKFIILLIFLFWNTSVFAEVVHLNCTVKWKDGDKSSKSFKLDSRTGSWWNKFTEETITWYGTIKNKDGTHGYIRHSVDRYTGRYTVKFLKDSKVKLHRHSSELKNLDIEDTRYGSCEKITGKKLF
tara:strand:+ start:102 stop:482 length:381 start_codon:yes stop_codon:yes gene_type:complete